MFRPYLYLSAAVATLVLPAYVFAHEGEGGHVHIGGLEVPLRPLVTFLIVFFVGAVLVARGLTHPLTRGNPDAGRAEMAALSFEIRRRAPDPVDGHRQKGPTMPAPAPAPEMVDAPPEMADA